MAAAPGAAAEVVGAEAEAARLVAVAQAEEAVAAAQSEVVDARVVAEAAVWAREGVVEAGRRALADTAATAGEAELLAAGAAAIPSRGNPMG